MKVKDLLEEARLGTEEYKNKKNIETIVESFDDDIDNYKISSVIKESNDTLLNQKTMINEDILRNLAICQNKIELIEEKAENMTPLYAKMKFNSIKKNLATIEESLSHKKILNSLNEDLLTYDLALIKSKMDELAECAEIETYNFEFSLAEKVNEEAEVIKKIIN